MHRRNEAFDDDAEITKLEGEIEDLNWNLEKLERKLDQMEDKVDEAKHHTKQHYEVLSHVLNSLADPNVTADLTALVITLKLEGADQSTVLSRLQSFYNL